MIRAALSVFKAFTSAVHLRVTFQIVMIHNVLISDYLFELSLWQSMLGTLMTVQKHVVGIQIGVTLSVRLYVTSLTPVNIFQNSTFK